MGHKFSAHGRPLWKTQANLANIYKRFYQKAVDYIGKSSGFIAPISANAFKEVRLM
jgi:hypothetical protein